MRSRLIKWILCYNNITVINNNIMKTKEIIIQELEQIPASQLDEVLDFIRSLKPTFQPREKPYKPIWEVADDIIKDIPEEVLSQLPKDGAEHHDLYLSKNLYKDS
ncbi:hypothetical protein [Planktothrix agardhii]|jgi:hypothetical protein|nr:hypothetical protein [Planktothrix agardhii]MCP9294977.1 hypothetical protein [Planktothrix agardhii LY1]